MIYLTSKDIGLVFDGVELPKYNRRTQTSASGLSYLHAELFGESESESGAEASTQDRNDVIKKQRTSCFPAHPGLSNFQGHRSCV
jgi:hypothetical protein